MLSQINKNHFLIFTYDIQNNIYIRKYWKDYWDNYYDYDYLEKDNNQSFASPGGGQFTIK